MNLVIVFLKLMHVDCSLENIQSVHGASVKLKKEHSQSEMFCGANSKWTRIQIHLFWRDK